MHYSNRTKYQGKDIRVARNHEEVESPNDALYIRVGNYTSGKMTTFHPDEARTIAAALIEAADEFDAAVEEANKPKLPTEPGVYISNSYTKYEDTDPSSFALFILDSDTGAWSVSNTRSNVYDSPEAAHRYAQHMVDSWGPLKRLVVED